MAKIPRSNTTLLAINCQESDGQLRPYLGMSQLGHSCDRYLWYYFRWCHLEKFSNRIQRLFRRGHREEPDMIKELEQVGVKCGELQMEFTAAYGHSKGHNDGTCIGVVEAPKTTHLLECKTMSDKYFKQVVKLGVKAAKPEYYCQCQIYMKKAELTRTLFIAVNKNDDSYYIERLYYVKETADELERRAERIVLAELPPDRPFKSTWYECKYCGAREQCHFGATIEKTCRTCTKMDLLPEGRWACNKTDKDLTTQEQRNACDSYKLIEGL